MLALFRTLADIALWRRSPRDLPASTSALALIALLYVACHAVEFRIRHSAGPALLVGLADLGVTAVCFTVLLGLTRSGHRLPQTLLAVLGTRTVLAPLGMGLLAFSAHAGSGGALMALLTLVWLTLLVWNLFIIGHIVRAALDTSLFTGMAVAVTYAILTIAVQGFFLPARAGLGT